MSKHIFTENPQVTGKRGNVIYSSLGGGIVGSRALNSKQAPLNEVQKRNAAGFAELARHRRYLGRILRVSFPPESDGTKWGNRFTRVNMRVPDLITTEPVNPGAELDPKRKATEEFTSTIDWTKAIFAEGPLRIPSLTVSLDSETRSVTVSQTSGTIEGTYASDSDLVYLVTYSPGSGFALLTRLKPRGEGGMSTVEIPTDVDTADLHFYAFAVTANGKTTSKSVYFPAGV